MEPQDKPAEGKAGRRRREQLGVVVSASMQKSVVVAVVRTVRHATYRKSIKRTSTFMAHDELGAQKGDTVRIIESRPLSARKRWRVIEVVARASAAAVAPAAAAS